MATINTWTGKTLTLTVGNIKNKDHYKSTGVKSSVASNPLGLSTSFTYTGASVDTNAKTSLSLKVGNLTTLTNNSYTISHEGAFLGATGSYTYSSPSTSTIKVYQANSVTSGVAASIWVGNSTKIQWTNTSNAYDKTATISSSAAGISLPSTVSGNTNSMSVTGITGGLSSTVSSTENIVNITANNSSGVTMASAAAASSTTATITVKNPVNSIATSVSSLAINSSSGAEGEAQGYATFKVSTIKNTNNFLVYSAIATASLTNNNVTLSKSSNITTSDTIRVTAKSSTGNTSDTITINSADGANKVSSKPTISVTVAHPNYNGTHLNIGQEVEVKASSLAANTSITSLSSNNTSYVYCKDKIIKGMAEGTTTIFITTSDGCIFKSGDIIVAPDITITFYKSSTLSDDNNIVSDMNFGDTVVMVIVGGTDDTLFDVGGPAGFSFSATSKIAAEDIIYMTAPSSGTDGDFTITVDPVDSNGNVIGAQSRKTINITNLTFSLS